MVSFDHLLLSKDEQGEYLLELVEELPLRIAPHVGHIFHGLLILDHANYVDTVETIAEQQH